MMPTRQRLRLRPDHERVVTIKRRAPEQRDVTGIVCRVGTTWAMVHSMNAFDLDGWISVRVDDVDRLCHEEHERLATKALRGEGWLAAAEHPELRLDDTAELLKSLSTRPIVALECEGDDDFLFGRLLRVATRSAVLHHVDCAGKWLRHATRFALSDVTLVELGSRYCETYGRYARPWKVPSGVNPRSRRDRAGRTADSQ
jgi:hypothetical protein